ncbi:MAG: hypothetical protein ACOYW7_01290 [Nitrospirota bacterium]
MNAMEKRSGGYLSKSLYIRGLQCHKSLYLHKHNPKLKDEAPAELGALFQTGYEVGEHAKKLFPNGVEIPYEGLSHEAQIAMTLNEFRKGSSTIYEATFIYDDVFVRVDILNRGPEGWEIYEVKSSTEVKDVHLEDTAIQYYVLAGVGLHAEEALCVVVHIHPFLFQFRKAAFEVSDLFSVMKRESPCC